MPDQWYYEHEMKKCGPVSSRQLRKIAAAGLIRLTDTIWKEGVEQGVAAAKVKNLFPPAPAAPPPPSPDRAEAPAAPPVAEPPVPEPPVPEPPAPDQSTAPEPAPEAAAEAPGPAASPSPAAEGEPAAPAEDAKPTPAPAAPAPPKHPVKQARAIAIRGLIISGQDGTHVQFKKKCAVCGHEDPNKVRVPIKNGMNRMSFFCKKCKKVRQAEFQGVL